MIPLSLRRLPAIWRSAARPRLARSRRWLVAYLRFAWAVRFGNHASLDRPERLTVILLSYRRPANLEPLCRSALACPFVDRVVVSNAEPSVRIRDWVGLGDSRLVFMDGEPETTAARRFEIARHEPGVWFAAIDDDLFITPHQIAVLFGHLVDDPHVLHGFRGQVRVRDGSAASPLSGGRARIGEVDILNCAYFFTADHAREHGEITARLGHHGPGDDIVASFCGTALPRCHAIGRYPLCPTSDEPGIAISREPGFQAHRAEVYARLLEIKPDRRKATPSTPERQEPA